jgi:hypothetical protein
MSTVFGIVALSVSSPSTMDTNRARTATACSILSFSNGGSSLYRKLYHIIARPIALFSP